MDLEDEVGKATEIAKILDKFKDPVSDHRTEIKRTIAELQKLREVLLKVKDAYRNSDERTIANIRPDLALVQDAVSGTLSAVWEILGRTGNGSPTPTKSDYRKTWKEISLFCHSGSRDTLSDRIKFYRRFLAELSDLLKKKSSNILAIEDMRDDIQSIVDAQEEGELTRPDPLSLAVEAGLPRQKSYERDRPPSSPTDSRSSWLRDYPPVPEVPISPISPSLTTSTTSWSSTAGVETMHWAKEIFKDPEKISATRLLDNNDQDPSACYGEPMQYAKDHMEYKFEPLFRIQFPYGMVVQLYHRERDHRAKILCETPTKYGQSWYSAVGLNLLEIMRRGSTELCLCRPRPGSRPHTWTSLHFLTIERLVLFFCTFLSLRSHDLGQTYSHIRDFELQGEDEHFGAPIRDDGYNHALRVYKDKYSRAVRLQASVLVGSMKNTPIWTAFITHKIHSPTWLRRGDRRATIRMQELHRHVFSPRYSPPVTANGEHLLEFTNEEDTIDFLKTIRELVAAEKRP